MKQDNTETLEPIEEPVTNEFVNKMTLELLMGKKHYSRYTSKTNPLRFNEMENYFNNIKQYRERILEITQNLIYQPKTQITVDVNEAFECYMKSLINYFKMKDIEKQSLHHEHTDIEDTLFGGMDEDIQNDEVDDANDTMCSSSFWSKERVLKKR